MMVKLLTKWKNQDSSESLGLNGRRRRDSVIPREGASKACYQVPRPPSYQTERRRSTASKSKFACWQVQYRERTRSQAE
jgi:hypothetical protein